MRLKSLRRAEAVNVACHFMSEHGPDIKLVEILNRLEPFLGRYVSALMACFGQPRDVTLDRCPKKLKSQATAADCPLLMTLVPLIAIRIDLSVDQ